MKAGRFYTSLNRALRYSQYSFGRCHKSNQRVEIKKANIK